MRSDVNDIVFRHFEGLHGLEELRRDWEALQLKCPSATFYQTYEWYACALSSLFRDSNDCFVVCAYRGDDALAIFPFQLTTERRLGISLRILQLPTHPHAVLRDFLLHPSLYEVGLFARLQKYLKHRRGLSWDILRIGRQHENSAADRLIREQEISFSVSSESGSIAAIGCIGRHEDNIAHVSSHFRRNLRRLSRKAEQRGPVSFMACADSECLKESLRLFIDIENDSWKYASGSSIASQPSLVEFYGSLLQRFNSKNHCQINLLKIGDQVVAAQFGIKSIDTFFILKIGFRQGYSDLGPGNLLLEEVLRHFANDSSINMVNLTTSPEWAEKWKNQSVRLYSHFLFRPTIKGTMAYIGFQFRTVLKRLSSRMNNVAQQSESQPS